MSSTFRVLSLVTALLATPASLTAQVVTWQGGGGDNNFTTGANWVGGVAPSSGTTTGLVFAGSSGGAVNNTGSAFTLQSVVFDGINGPFVVSGSPLTLAGYGFVSNNSNFIGRFSADVTLATSVYLGGSGYLVFDGALSDPSNYGLTVANTQLTELAGTFALGNVNLSSGAYVNFSGDGTIGGTVDAYNALVAFGGGAANARTLTSGASLRATGNGRIDFIGGTTRFDGTVSIGPGGYVIQGGKLDGTGPIDFNLGVNDVFTFADGSLLGTAAQSASVNGGYAQFNGINGVQKVARQFIVRSPDVRLITGTLEMIDSGTVTFDGTVAQVRDSGFVVSASGTGNALRLTNGAVLQKVASSGGGTFQLNAPLELGNGLLYINAGTVRLGADSTHPETGSIQVDPGAALELGAGTQRFNGVGLYGGGIVRLSGGALVTDPANSNYFLGDPTGGFEVTGGVFSGGNNTMFSAFTWSGGSFTNAFGPDELAFTVMNNTFVVSGTGTRVSDRRSVNFGNGIWSGADLQLSGSSTGLASFNLNGPTNAVWSIQSDQSVLPGTNPNVQFTIFNGSNRLRKEFSFGTTTFAIPFSNGGTLEVNSGRVLLSAGTGSFASFGNYALGGSGMLEFGGGTHVLQGGGWSGTGRTIVSAGTVRFDVGLNFGASAGTLDLTGGTLTGNPTFILQGANVNWGGTRLTTTLPSPNVTSAAVNGTFNIVGSDLHVLDRRSLNFPNGTWSGGDIQINGATNNLASLNLNGASGSIFRITSDQNVVPGPDGFAQFTIFASNNRLIKESTSGTTNFNVPFSSAGSVEVNAGRVLLSAGTGSFQSVGTYTVAAGAMLEFGGGTHQLSGGNWSGAGRTVVSAGTLQINNGFNVGSSAGTFDLTGGTLTGTAFPMLGTVNWSGATIATSLPQPNIAFTTFSGPLNLVGTATHVLDRRNLTIGAGGTWTDGDLQISGANNGASAFLNFNAPSGTIFRIQSDRTVLAGPGGNAAFIIQGSFNRFLKDTTSGTTNIAVPFSQAGSVEVNTGRLLLSAGTATSFFQSTGSYTVAAGAMLEFGGGTHQLAGGNWSGTGRTVVSAGTLQINNGFNVGSSTGTFDLTGGTLTGTAFPMLGTVNWSGSTITTSLPQPNIAFTTFSGPLNLVGTATHVLDRRNLTIGAGGTWTDGDLQISGANNGASSFLNFNAPSGTIFRIQSDRTVLAGPGGNAAFIIQGSFNRFIKDTTSGTTNIAVPFSQAGAIEVNTGRLLLSAGTATSFFQSTGSYAVAADATLEFGGGTHQLSGGNWSGAGRTVVSAGALQINNGFNVGSSTGTFDLTGGTLTGTAFPMLGTVNWSGSTITTSLPQPNVAFTTFSGPLNLVGGATHQLDRRNLTLAAGGTWTDGDILINGANNGSSTFVNLNGPSGTIFRVQTDRTMLFGPGGNAAFVIQGAFNRFIKDTTTGTTTIGIPFSQGGQVEVNSGRLLLTGGSANQFFQNFGTWTVSDSAILEFGGGTHQLSAAAWSGNGRTILSAGTLSASNSLTIGSLAGPLDLTGGTLSGTDFNLAASVISWSSGLITTTLADPNIGQTLVAGPFNVIGVSTHTLERRALFLSNGGTWSGGALELAGSNGSPAILALNGPAFPFRITCDQPILLRSGTLGSVSVLPDNLLRKESSTGTTQVFPCLNNQGTVEVASGTLQLSSFCSANSGLLLASSGGTLRVDGYISGDGNVTVASGGTLILENGIYGGGQYSIAGTLDLRGGYLGNGSNTTTVQTGGRVTGGGTLHGTLVNNGTISPTSNLTLTGAVTNNGSLILRNTSAYFYGPSFVNNGILDVITGNFYNLGGGTFVNNGIVLDSSVVKVKRVTKAGTSVQIVVDGYPEHVYLLQYSADLQSFTTLGATQTGTGGELTFTDTNNGAKGFYRVVVDPTSGGLGNRAP